jgi:SRSO17 transposase
VVFGSKFAQAVQLIARLGAVFADVPVLVVADSWFGNNGLFKPLRERLGARVNLLSRLRVNAALYAIPARNTGRPGRPRKYGKRLGNAADLAAAIREQTRTYTVHVYGALREVQAADRVVMLKTLRCPVRVVWVYRRTQWVALMTTDLGLSVEQIVEYYAARWKIEAGFREIKQEIGSAHTQTRNPDAVTNHLHFCMAATTITWIYAEHLNQAPIRRYASENTTEYAFADVRRSLARHLAKRGFDIDCQDPDKPYRNPLISTVMRLVA